jgi:anti-sigma B factor antagonist
MTNRRRQILTLAEPTIARGGALSVLDVCVIELSGPLLGAPRVDSFCDLTEGLLDRGAKNLAINLAQVPYADSYGVGSLVATFNLACQAGARIRFFAASQRLAEALKRLHLDTVFDLYEDETSAVASFRKAPELDHAGYGPLGSVAAGDSGWIGFSSP